VSGQDQAHGLVHVDRRPFVSPVPVAVFLSVLLALVASASNATSNIIQRIANRDEQNVATLSLRLVKDLLHRPLWFAGIGTVTFSFLLQATALRFGALALVEPLLAFELPLTFVGAAVVLKAPLGQREWTSAAVMTLGLAGLIFFLDPHGGHKSAPLVVWALGLSVSEGVVAALVVAGWRTAGDARAAFYGAATGIQFGTTAALMNGAVAHVERPVVLFTTWQTYAMAASGIFGLFLLQNAMQAGKILAAQPGITLLDPVVAILWGIVVFHEHSTARPGGLAMAGLGGLLMIAGGVLLSRSPILEHHIKPARARKPEAQTAPEGALSG
jgi:drug/metabolite transporter (DMT)-like permease